MDFDTEIKPFLQAVGCMMLMGLAAFAFLLFLIWGGSFLAYQEKQAKEYFETQTEKVREDE